MKAPVAFGIISLGVLAFACAPRPRGTEPAAARTAKTPREQDARAVATPHIESALAVNVNDVSDGVRFDFRVTNAGGTRVEVNFPSGQTHEVIVLDTLGREVWRWSNGRMFTQVLQNKVLHREDTLAYGERWKNAPRGQYVAVARLASANYPVEQRAQFEVP